MKKIFQLFSLFLFLILVSCNQDNMDPINEINSGTQTGNEEFSAYFGNPIPRTFLGTVIDKDHNPIPDVTITIGDDTAQTDANGVFVISDASVYTRFGYVKAEKVGYLTGSRSVVPSQGTNKVTIILLEKSVTATVNSGSEEMVTLVNGSSVRLPGNYVDENGTAYTGSLDVVLHHLDPADEDMPLQMPGMLYGANSNNQERMLQTYGMLAVELIGSSGEKLNLAEGSTAEITVPLDVSLQGNAPATIPLWHFDETYGYWVEDGEATLDGTNYVGTVSHFSFWNCDIPAEAVTLCVNVTDESENMLSNLWVTMTSTVYGTRGGYTNQIGEVCGLVPRNETLGLNIYNYEVCNDSPIYTSTIGPFSSDSSTNITIPNNPDLILETVTGNFNDCDGNPVSEGYVSLSYANQTFIDYVTEGNFEIDLIRCTDNDTFGVEAVDYINLQTTDSLSYTFTTPLTNLGTLSSCNDVDEFITYQVDDHPAIIYTSNFQSGLDASVLFVNFYSPNQEYNFQLNIQDFNSIGTYSNGVYINFFDMNLDSTTLEFYFLGTASVSTFGNVGEYIDINFYGNLVDLNNPGSLTPIFGTIHVIRNI